MNWISNIQAQLEDFVDKLFAPCIILIEEIESFAYDRGDDSDEGDESRGISGFLQFMSGISTKRHPVVVIATTNHLAKLDEAIRNRPVRFNRIWEFAYPTDDQINALVDMFFKLNVDGCSEAISLDNKSKLYGKNFTGAHINEIRRSAELIAKRKAFTSNSNTDGFKITNEVFSEAIKPVVTHFSMGK